MSALKPGSCDHLKLLTRHQESVENLQVLTWTFSQNICSLARCQVLGTCFPDVRDQLEGQQGGVRGLLLRKELIDPPGCCRYPDLCVHGT